ncbi:GAF and ANTAR domain-containing protein [Pseudarthrobacter sp. NPDC055928]|uniref:GAF and ANTAR domain-containing protein n=1 Tax=Pseudarthrobacter sp. NPDC055928 TaxID=3345661 RepID=UPI0035D913C0
MVAETPGDAGWESLPASQDVVFDSKEVESFLGEVTHEFMRRIDGHRRGISWAATFFRLGDAHTIAAGSDVARAADQEQCSFEDGPGLEAIRSGEFVHLADTARDRRWPGYAAAAADHGVRSLLCMPIVSTAGSSAAINLYASTPHAFTSEDIVLTRAYAREVARALRVVLRVAERAEASAELAVAQSSMVLMDLAISALMADYGLSREVALQYLRTVAKHNNQGLRDAALNIVAASRRDPVTPGLDDAGFAGLMAVESPARKKGPYKTGSSA